MADTKITALAAITTVDPAADVLPIVDVSDTSMAASGTTKKITSNQILGAGGTATLASATITGDLTVRTNKLKVDSNGVAVGTTTSSTGGGVMCVEHTSNNGLVINSAGGSPTIYLRNTADSSNAKIMFTDAINLTFANVSGTLATLTTGGNLGLGVTPSAWLSSWKAIQIKDTAYAADANSSYLLNNGYADSGGTYKYIASKYALQYSADASAGSHKWYTAPSGTAGNAITFTQAMTLDASGNLYLGASSSYLASRLNLTVTNGQPDAIYIRSSAASLSLYWRLGYVNSSNTFHILNQSGVGVYLTDGATSWTGTSDERLKDIIEPISDAVSKVSSLRSVIGKFKTDSEGTRRSFLIAQDVKSVLPEAVDSTNADALGVRYTEVIPLLVAAIKELSAEVNALKNK